MAKKKKKTKKAMVAPGTYKPGKTETAKPKKNTNTMAAPGKYKKGKTQKAKAASVQVAPGTYSPGKTETAKSATAVSGNKTTTSKTTTTTTTTANKPATTSTPASNAPTYVAPTHATYTPVEYVPTTIVPVDQEAIRTSYQDIADKAIAGYTQAYETKRKMINDVADASRTQANSTYDSGARSLYGSYLESQKSAKERASNAGMTGGAVERMAVQSSNNYNRGYAANESLRQRTLGEIDRDASEKLGAAEIEHTNLVAEENQKAQTAAQQAVDTATADYENRVMQEAQRKQEVAIQNAQGQREVDLANQKADQEAYLDYLNRKLQYEANQANLSIEDKKIASEEEYYQESLKLKEKEIAVNQTLTKLGIQSQEASDELSRYVDTMDQFNTKKKRKKEKQRLKNLIAELKAKKQKNWQYKLKIAQGKLSLWP